MGITLLTLGALAAPLQQFAGWLAGVSRSKPSRSLEARSAHARSVKCLRRSDDRSSAPGTGSGTRTAPASRRPLRVLRVVDSGHTSATAGRMVISGRMADVCAELERLAALEPDQALAPSR